VATWDSLKETRLRLRDPSGVINLEHVATSSSLPAVPLSQTAYRSDDTGIYAIYDSDLTTWSNVNLLVSDARLNNLIDLYGIDKSTIKAISYIISSLYERLNFVKLDAGAESTQYQTLNDTLAFYKALRDQYKEDAAELSGVDTGRYLKITPPSIAGGMEC
jgi:hypothetical protein